MSEFKQVLNNSAIPTTEDELKQAWQSELTNQGFVVNNASPVSPFWKLVDALITKPAKWIIDFAIEHIFPSLFVQTATGEELDRLGWERGLERGQQVKAYGKLTISRDDASGELSIPKGTVVYADNNGQRLNLILTSDVLFQDGDGQLSAYAEAEYYGEQYNLAVGYFVNFAEALDGVQVTNGENWLVTAGAEVETDDSFRNRIRDQYSLLSLHFTDDVYKHKIAEFLTIPVGNIFIDHDAPRGVATANAYVFAEVGSVLNADLTAVNNYLGSEGNHGLGDDVLVLEIDRALHDLNLTIAVTPNEGETQAEVLTQVENFIRCAFRENLHYECSKVAPFSTFSFSRLEFELQRQFSQITSIRFTALEIISQRALPTINSLVVNANG